MNIFDPIQISTSAYSELLEGRHYKKTGYNNQKSLV